MIFRPWFIWFFWLLFSSQCSWFVCIYFKWRIIFSLIFRNLFFCPITFIQSIWALPSYPIRFQDLYSFDSSSFSKDLSSFYEVDDPIGCDVGLFLDEIDWDWVYYRGYSCYVIFWILLGLISLLMLVLFPSTIIKI